MVEELKLLVSGDVTRRRTYADKGGEKWREQTIQDSSLGKGTFKLRKCRQTLNEAPALPQACVRVGGLLVVSDGHREGLCCTSSDAVLLVVRPLTSTLDDSPLPPPGWKPFIIRGKAG